MVLDEVVAARSPWSGVIAAGHTLRIVDLEGNQAVDFLAYVNADPAERYDAQIEARFSRFQDALGGLREVRSRQNIPPKTPLRFSVRCDAATADLLRPMEPYFETMAGAHATAWGADVQAPTASVSFLVTGGEVFVDLAGHIDVEAEITRNTKELGRLEKAVAAKERQLSNASFVERAPAEVIQKERAALEQLKQSQAATMEALFALRAAKK